MIFTPIKMYYHDAKNFCQILGGDLLSYTKSVVKQAVVNYAKCAYKSSKDFICLFNPETKQHQRFNLIKEACLANEILFCGRFVKVTTFRDFHSDTTFRRIDCESRCRLTTAMKISLLFTTVRPIISSVGPIIGVFKTVMFPSHGQ